MEPLRVGLLGVGDGLPLLRACRGREDIEVVAVCDRRTDRLADVAQRFGIAHAVTNDDRLLAHDGLDAVIITTPDWHHRRQAVAALDAGLHVFCAPPAGQTREDCAALLKAVEQHPRQRVMIGHLARFHKLFAAAHQLATDGTLGDIYAVRIEQFVGAGEFEGAGEWRQDERIATPPFLGVGHVALDLAWWMAGELVSVEARASQRVLFDLPFDDTVSARYLTDRGALVDVLLAAGARRPPGITLTLLGTDGSLTASTGDRHNDYWTVEGGETRHQVLPGDPSDNGVAAALDEFVAAVREERPPVVGVVEGVRVVAAGLAALASCEQKGATVAIAKMGRSPF